MLNVYPAIFHKEVDSVWVEFPDLEGCHTYGDSLPQTIELASDALGLYLAALLDKNLPVPAPSDITSVIVDDTCFVSYIYCDVTKYRKKVKSVKKTLTLPEWIDEEACRRNINFSQTLQKALIEQFENF